MALFGEKYPENVRVVRMGEFSRELCGGTHLENTSQVGLFKVIGEESVSAGTRRITALTGKAALDLVRHEEDLLAGVAAALKVPPAQARRPRLGPARRAEGPQEAGRAEAARRGPDRPRPTTCSPPRRPSAR